MYTHYKRYKYIYIYLYIWQRQLNMWRAGQTVSGPGGSIKYRFVYWNVVTVYMYYTTGWWLAFISPYTYWECHHPNWRTHISQRGRSSTNQILYANICIYYTIYVLYYNTLYVLYVPYIFTEQVEAIEAARRRLEPRAPSGDARSCGRSLGISPRKHGGFLWLNRN